MASGSFSKPLCFVSRSKKSVSNFLVKMTRAFCRAIFQAKSLISGPELLFCRSLTLSMESSREAFRLTVNGFTINGQPLTITRSDIPLILPSKLLILQSPHRALPPCEGPCDSGLSQLCSPWLPQHAGLTPASCVVLCEVNYWVSSFSS